MNYYDVTVVIRVEAEDGHAAWNDVDVALAEDFRPHGFDDYTIENSELAVL